MRRHEVVRLFKEHGGWSDGQQYLQIDPESLFKFLAAFEQKRAQEMLDTVAESRRKRTKDNMNSEILDKRRGLDVKARG
jgi:hypothetical protein